MKTLGIDLQSGFENDDVLIKINDQEVFHQEDVQYKMLLGYAETLQFQVPAGSTSVTISLPQKMLEDTIQLDLEADTYLGISITPDGIEHFVSDQPFFYQ